MGSCAVLEAGGWRNFGAPVRQSGDHGMQNMVQVYGPVFLLRLVTMAQQQTRYSGQLNLIRAISLGRFPFADLIGEARLIKRFQVIYPDSFGIVFSKKRRKSQGRIAGLN